MTFTVNPEYAPHLREKAAALPYSPGVYIMRSESGAVIYVGKSKSLKNRVTQYFNEGEKNQKTDAMTSKVADFEYIICDSEIEALALENSLIKLHTPKYNIKLKDGKTYPYIKVTNEEYPRFLVVRGRQADGATYIGPYSGTSTAYAIVASISRAFGLCSCRKIFPRDKGKVKHCLYRQLGCSAPCDVSVTSEEYREHINDAVAFISGGHGKLIASLTEKMNFASENLMFEAAALYRDRIASVKKLSDKQKVVSDPGVDADVFAVFEGDAVSCACALYIRDGKLTDSESFFFPASGIIDESSLSAFLFGLYRAREYPAKEILLSTALSEADAEALSGWLSGMAGHKVSIKVPERGFRRQLVIMAYENAAHKAAEYKESSEKSAAALIALASIAGLEVVPERIEAFDISNFGAEATTAGMTVFKNGRPCKSDYRSYNIRTVVRDDCGAMREALTRRFSDRDKSPLPDLILVDGGQTQLNAALEAENACGVSVPVLGMVKDDNHRTRALVSPDGEINFASYTNVYSLIYTIQEETHRFTVSKMTGRKRKTERTSVLESIKGIGAAKARTLLSAFGGLAGVKSAGREKLISVPGINGELADAIVDYFNKNKNKK